jgi:hypothetical protein
MGVFAVYDFWGGYHPTRSIAAGLLAVVFGLFDWLLYGAWSVPTGRSRDNPKWPDI